MSVAMSDRKTANKASDVAKRARDTASAARRTASKAMLHVEELEQQLSSSVNNEESKGYRPT